MTRIDRCTSLERLNHSSKKLTRHGRISIQVSVYSVGQLSVAANNSAIFLLYDLQTLPCYLPIQGQWHSDIFLRFLIEHLSSDLILIIMYFKMYSVS